VISAVVSDALLLVFNPVKVLARFAALASPDVTELSFEVLLASTDVRPDDTTPVI
jgi:hypothetical protein